MITVIRRNKVGRREDMDLPADVGYRRREVLRKRFGATHRLDLTSDTRSTMYKGRCSSSRINPTFDRYIKALCDTIYKRQKQRRLVAFGKSRVLCTMVHCIALLD
jgi:hypothetical protein